MSYCEVVARLGDCQLCPYNRPACRARRPAPVRRQSSSASQRCVDGRVLGAFACRAGGSNNGATARVVAARAHARGRPHARHGRGSHVRHRPACRAGPRSDQPRRYRTMEVRSFAAASANRVARRRTLFASLARTLM